MLENLLKNLEMLNLIDQMITSALSSENNQVRTIIRNSLASEFKKNTAVLTHFLREAEKKGRLNRSSFLEKIWKILQN